MPVLELAPGDQHEREFAIGLLGGWNDIGGYELRAAGRGREFVDEHDRLAGVDTVGVDEHIWHHQPRPGKGPKEQTGIVDLTRRNGQPRARLLDLVLGRSGKAYADWLRSRGDAFTAGITTATLDPFRGYANAIRDELDDAVGHWIARRTREEAVDAFEKAEAAIAPIHDVRDVMEDPQYRALGTITEVDDPELGPLRMQNVLFRLSETPGAIRWAGRPHGADTDAILAEAGLSAPAIAALRDEGAL